MPLDEVAISVDEGTGKSSFIDRQLGMSVSGFWGPDTRQVAGPPLGLDQTSRVGYQGLAGMYAYHGRNYHPLMGPGGEVFVARFKLETA